MKISNYNKKFSKLFSNEVSSAESFFCAHVGPSMNPTLTAKDLLEIKPYTQNKSKSGDVILFKSPEKDNYVVHRIISIKPKGIQTRGDNNSHFDPWYLKTQDIYGQVISAQRGEICRKITGGFRGRVTGLFCQLRLNFLSLLTKILRPAYRSLCTNGFLHWLIPVRRTPQVATFRSETNASHKLLLGKRIIGSYDESLLQWQIRRPYRLLIDETSLPTPR
jgi:hypothetical protein